MHASAIYLAGSLSPLQGIHWFWGLQLGAGPAAAWGRIKNKTGPLLLGENNKAGPLLLYGKPLWLLNIRKAHLEKKEVKTI